MTANDLDLLRQFARDHSQDAFTALVRRHLDLVHSAALRQVRSPDLAGEVSQSVFADLARNADKLKPDTILTAWLYQVTRRTAIDVVRRESRRRARERLAVEMAAMNPTTADWNHIEPLLDEAMDALDETDRTAVLLRFFENKSLREVGRALGTSDDTAQKRVSRAVERLREFFVKRGATVGAGGLAVAISANAVQAAPVALAATISSAAVLAGTTLTTAATTLTATKALAMTTLQKTLATGAIVAAIGTGIYEARQASTLRAQNLALEQQQSALAGRLQESQQGRNDVSNRLGALLDENAALKLNQTELPRLRAEATRLREDSKKATVSTATSDPVAGAAKDWLNRVQLLKARLAVTPGAGIPELSLLEDNDWLNAVQNNKLETDDDYHNAFKALRYTAQSDFASLIKPALQQYVATNNGSFPTNLSQLQPFLGSPIDPAALARWTVASSWAVPNVGVGDMIITQKSASDPQYDNVFAIGINGYGSMTPPPPEAPNQLEMLDPALVSYYTANGQIPGDPLQLLPYATTAQQTNILMGAAKDYMTMSPQQKGAAQKEIQMEIQRLMSR